MGVTAGIGTGAAAPGPGGAGESDPIDAGLGDLKTPARGDLRGRSAGTGWRGAGGVVAAGAVLAVLLGIWQVLVDLTHTPAIEIATPSAAFAAIADNPGYFASNAGWTLEEAALGFVVAFVVAISSAALIVHSRLADRALSPLITVLQVTPILVLAPPLVLILGIGIAPRVVEAALVTFVPLARNAVEGFGSVDRDTLELMRSVDATRRQIFRSLRLPNSAPYLVTGVKICAPLALIGAVISEFQQSSAGLGYVMISAYGYYKVSDVYAAVFVLMFLGVCAVGAVTAVGKRYLRWRG